MSELFSYHITHIQLHEPLVLPCLVTQQGNYLVFWWYDIALGHLFLDPNQLLTETTYYSALYAAIQASLLQYSKTSPLGVKSYVQWLDLVTTGQWHTRMASALSPILPPTLPAVVPISVVICTRNRATALTRCLAAIRAMPTQPAEIIIVDNAPTDASTHRTTQAHEGVNYYVEPKPGLSHARNTGIARATQEVIAFTDDDVLVHTHWAYRVWETFQQQEVMAMTGLVLVAELNTEAQLIFEKHWSFNRGYTDVVYDTNYVNQTPGTAPLIWDIGAGANMAFRKAIFAQVGPFDARLGAGTAGCSEDSEMWFRILFRDQIIHYNPRAIVYHTHRREITELRKQVYAYLRGHMVAAFVQHAQQPQAGYDRHMLGLGWKYIYLTMLGFPHFRFRYRTLWVEIKGVVAGIAYYFRHRTLQR